MVFFLPTIRRPNVIWNYLRNTNHREYSFVCLHAQVQVHVRFDVYLGAKNNTSVGIVQIVVESIQSKHIYIYATVSSKKMNTWNQFSWISGNSRRI